MSKSAEEYEKELKDYTADDIMADLDFYGHDCRWNKYYPD